MDALGWDLREVEIDAGRDALADATALLDLRRDAAGDDVARRKFHLLWRILLHEALAVFVDEQRALSTARLREQDAVDRKARRVELHHLRVLERDADVHAGDDAVARRAVRVRRADPVGAAVAARRDDDGLGGDADDVAAAHVHGDDASELVLLLARHRDLEHLALGDEVDVVRKALLKERVDHRVAGAVLEVSGACMGVAAHLALMEMAVILAVVGIAHVVHLVDVLAGALDKVLDGILVAEVVAALYGIEGMRLEAVVRVRDARDAVHATLCHRRGRTRRHELRQHGNLEVLVLRCSERGAHAGTTAADDQNIVCDITLLDFFRYVPAIPGEVRSRCQDDTGCRCALDEGAARNFP